MGIRCLGLADTIVTPGNSLCMQVSSAASKTLPRAAVELAVAGQVHKLPTLPPSLNPRLPATSHHFSNVPLKSNIRLKVGGVILRYIALKAGPWHPLQTSATMSFPSDTCRLHPI